MQETGFTVALVGRTSRSKTAFLQAASSTESPISADNNETRVWYTSSIAPREDDLTQAPANGFSPAGERLLSVQLKHASVGDISGEGLDTPPAILLVVAPELVFCKGRPRPSRTGVNPLRAAVTRFQERLGGPMPFAVAVSIDVEEADDQLMPTLDKSFLATVKAELEGDHIPVVLVSPRTEMWLLEQQREGGRVSYRRGGTDFRIRPGFEHVMDKGAVERARAIFEVCGGTGIQAAVSAAIALQPTALVFPVADFHTLQSSGWEGNGAPLAAMRTCCLCRASSTARDVFAAQKVDGIWGGDLLRAEIIRFVVDPEARNDPLALGLDTPLGAGAWLLRLTANRKPVPMWQAGAKAGAVPGKALPKIQFGDLRGKDRRRGKS